MVAGGNILRSNEAFVVRATPPSSARPVLSSVPPKAGYRTGERRSVVYLYVDRTSKSARRSGSIKPSKLRVLKHLGGSAA